MKIIVVVDKDNKKKNQAIKDIKSIFKGHELVEIAVSELDEFTFDKKIIKKEYFDFVLAVGGDGTIIKTAKIFYKYDMKILAINIGQLGFLSGVDKIDALKRIKLKDINDSKIIKRDLLKCELFRNGKRIDSSYALNEFLLCSNEFGLMGKYDFSYGKDQHINTFHSDGIIVSTETGSTAYAFSCGGPIIENEAHCIMLIPIRSHSCNERAFILNDKKVIKTQILRSNQVLKVDGRDNKELKLNDVLVFTKDKKQIKFIDMNNESFFERALSRIKVL